MTDTQQIEPRTTLTQRFAGAVAYASRIHADQVRKGSDVTYTAHLLAVASLVLEAGGDEELAIAALLHDAVEDCGGMPRAAEIRAEYGDRVADVVLGCSDATDPEWKRTVDYWTRKQAYLDHLATADGDVLLVSLADKVHNARSIQTDLEARGLAAMGKFKATPGQTLRYYRTCLEIGQRRGAPEALVLPLAHAVEQLEQHLQTAPPALGGAS